MWIPGDHNFHQNFGSRKFRGEQQEKSTRLCINPLLRPFTTTEKALLMLMPWAFTTTEALSKALKNNAWRSPPPNRHTRLILQYTLSTIQLQPYHQPSS
jgi:hypothetical protein